MHLKIWDLELGWASLMVLPTQICRNKKSQDWNARHDLYCTSCVAPFVANPSRTVAESKDTDNWILLMSMKSDTVSSYEE